MVATVSKPAASGLYYKFLVQITGNGFLDNSLVQQFSRLKNMSDIGSKRGHQYRFGRGGGFRQGVSELVEWVQSQREVHDGVDGAWTELERRGLLS